MVWVVFGYAVVVLVEAIVGGLGCRRVEVRVLGKMLQRRKEGHAAGNVGRSFRALIPYKIR
jgi:hypothetical protein